eukprot:GHVU01214364.1.p1 GENE.GHVU01214364.1~~GHVU01214364.1.p1  ORF type:complete len:503 (-),score=44.08 GHVU01214364.1:112-1437(-)
MTSQTWLDATYSNRHIWWHQMYIAIPYAITHPGYAFQYITGGSNSNPDSVPLCSDSNIEIMAAAADDTGMIGAMLRQVPNQPILMAGDPYNEERSEDNWISWTWNQYVYLNHNGSIPVNILARFPMTKAGKAGLDTIQAVAATEGYNIDKFLICGASKRGWTTWSLAATDVRVVGALPLVFTLVNISDTMMKHYQSLGGYSWALVDYYVNNLTRILADPERKAMVLPHEDMWNYKERYADVPMINIVGTGDQFFQPDDSHYWLTDMPGWNHMLIIPNIGHGMAPTYPRIYETGVAFFQFISNGRILPDFEESWTNDANGGSVSFRIAEHVNPIDVLEVEGHVGESNNETHRGLFRRDFRVMDPLPTSVWFEPNFVEDLGDGTFRTYVEKGPDKYQAIFLEAQFESTEGDNKLWLSTQFHVVPDEFPYPPCQTPDECAGELV